MIARRLIVATSVVGLIVSLGGVPAVAEAEPVEAAPSAVLRTPNYSPTGPTPRDLTTGDIDGDGNADLVLAAENAVRIALGRGDGSFEPYYEIDVGAFARYVEVADVNEDSVGDVIVSTKLVKIFISDGSETQIQNDRSYGAIDTGDIDGDGHVDLLFESMGSPYVSFGNGDGSFTEREIVTTIDVDHLSLADVDGDQLLDVATMEDDTNVLTIWRNGGQRNFEQGASARLGSDSDVFANGNLDGDNSDELIAGPIHRRTLAVASLSRSNELELIEVPTRDIVGALAVGDVAAGPEPDLIYGGSRGNVSILANDGGGDLKASDRFPAGYWVSVLATADFNGDGRSDIASLSKHHPGVTVFIQGQGGMMIAPENQDIDLAEGHSAWGDLDGDGDAEFVRASWRSLTVFSSGSTGAYELIHSLPPIDAAVWGLSLSDVTGDGDLDAIAYVEEAVIVWLGSAGSDFSGPIRYEIDDPAENDWMGRAQLAMADVIGDNHVDVALVTEDNTGFVLEGAGDGTFVGDSLLDATERFEAVTTADVDGDESRDVVGATEDAVCWYSLRDDRKTCFELPTGDSHTLVNLDADHDDDQDLVVSSQWPDKIVILSNDGAGDFSAVESRSAGMFAPSVSLVGDLNMDGWDDVAIGGSGGSLSILYQGNEGLGESAYIGVPASFTSIAIVDMDGDLRPDIPFVRNTDIGGRQMGIVWNETPGETAGRPRLDSSRTSFTQGGISLRWAHKVGASTYTLQGKDEDDSAVESVAVTSQAYDSFPQGSPPEGTWTFRVVPEGDEGQASAPSIPIVVDRTAPTPPTLTTDSAPDATVGDTDWFKDSAVVTTTPGEDPGLPDGSPGSGVSAGSVPGPQALISTGLVTLNRSNEDRSGNRSAEATLTLGVDATHPEVTCDAETFFLGEAAALGWSATDVGSGLLTPASGTALVDTTTLGHKFVEIPAAEDAVGHVVSGISCGYDVVFPWETRGQAKDSDALPATQNKVPVRRGVPIRFSLGGDRGLEVFAKPPASRRTDCLVGGVQQRLTRFTDAAPKTLIYAPARQTYIYRWRSLKRWTGTCRLLTFKLIDGTSHSYRFKFVKG